MKLSGPPPDIAEDLRKIKAQERRRDRWIVGIGIAWFLLLLVIGFAGGV